MSSNSNSSFVSLWCLRDLKFTSQQINQTAASCLTTHKSCFIYAHYISRPVQIAVENIATAPELMLFHRLLLTDDLFSIVSRVEIDNRLRQLTSLIMFMAVPLYVSVFVLW